jgi:uncharacterized membrane protein
MTLKYGIAYVATAIVFLAADFVWLTRVASQFYRNRIGDILLDKPLYAAAVGFYAVYVIGIVFFAVAPALRSQSVTTALLNGALFGFFCYATYDLTNYSTLKGWSLAVSAVDVAWGTILTAGSAAAGFFVTRLLLR